MKQDVLIAGGGIAGLCAAFELSQNPDINVTIIEASTTCGGKMRGYYDTARGQFVEHSIRALGSTYFSLFDIFHRAGILDHLSPVEAYQFYEKSSGKRVAIDRTGPITPSTMVEMIHHFGLSAKDMATLAERILHHVNASDEERAAMACQKAGDVIGIEDFEPATRQFIVNWFGILTGARMHSKAVDIMDSFLLMFMPMSQSPHLPPGKQSKSYCFNRPTSQVIDALVDVLQGRGVRIVTRTPITHIARKGGKVVVETGSDALAQASFDAAIMAVPHEVMGRLGLLETGRELADEWSFGAQFPMERLPDTLKPFAGKFYNLCFDAPWNIVFQIQSADSFWTDVSFPQNAPYNLSATSSSPHVPGALFGKKMGECTPEEVLHEVLFQLGITDAAERTALAQNGVVDPVYYRFTKEWQDLKDTPTVEMGPLHPDGARWVNGAQIYVRAAQDPIVQPASTMEGVFLSGEVVTVPGMWKIPTMEQAATSAKQAAQLTFDYLDLPDKVSIETATIRQQHLIHAAELILKGVSKLV